MGLKRFSDRALAIDADGHFVLQFKRLGEELELLRRQWAVKKRHPDVCFDKVALEGEEYPWASLSEGAVRAFESGERTPQLATLVSLLEIYGELVPATIGLLFAKIEEDINAHVEHANTVAAEPQMTNARLVAEHPRIRGGVIPGPDGRSDKV